MLATHLTALAGDPLPGVAEALAVIDGLDDSLLPGLARLDSFQTGALAALAGAVAASPMADRVAEAVDKIVTGAIGDEYLIALAGARTALFGAVHDAVLGSFDAAAGRSRPAWEPAPVTETDIPGNLLAGAQSWLRELAITGWRGIGHDVVSGSAQILQAVLGEPRLRRLAVLLDGLAGELAASAPVSTMDLVPVRRWADLWARALLLCQPGAVATASPVLVSGRLLVLGVEVHEHATAVQFQVHALLEPSEGAGTRLVRTGVTVSKVDTIVGPAVWNLPRECPVLLAALAGKRALEITDLPLLASGDLVWRDDQATPGEPVDPFATARVLLAGATAPPVPPLDRHPVRIAEPVLVADYKARVDPDTGATLLDLGDASLPVAVDRLPSCGPLTREAMAASSACLGLMRWDAGQWTLQPLAVQTTAKRKTATVATADWALAPSTAKASKSAKSPKVPQDTVAVLRERAGRLLRK